MARPRPRPATVPPRRHESLFAEDEDTAAAVGEGLRRAALGLTAALLVGRAFFPGEDADAGSGLGWLLLLFAAAAMAIAGQWAAGSLRLRISAVDLAFLLLVALVGLSVTGAAERRAAITLAWEWAGLAVAYLLMRNLPRSRSETEALAGVLVATAVALACYGLYQAVIEFPALKAAYLANPRPLLEQMGVDPDSPAARQSAEQRLLGSSEVFATFALANSLAGFLVGPTVAAIGVALANALDRRGREPPWRALALAAIPVCALLACLVLTKSRSGYVGLIAGVAVLGWRVRGRALWIACVVLVSTLGALTVIAAAMRQLDWQVLTESTRSLRFRTEYWIATWRLINGSSRVFFGGLGPGNFAGPYLRYKLPQASEEIRDPHNFLLEVWTTAGLVAVVVLLIALGLALRAVLRTSRGGPAIDEPAGRSGWLWICGAGGWLLVVALGKLNPFEGDGLARWLVLGAGWAAGAAGLGVLWRRQPIPAGALGAGALAVLVNLLAAGGIGYPPVALCLWALIALGLNLRNDLPAGTLRQIGGRWSAFGAAAALAALGGSFVGSALPQWRAQGALEAARLARDPARIQMAYLEAVAADRYSAAPWLGLAELAYRDWRAHGSAPGVRVWPRIAELLDRAARPPLNPNSLVVQRRRIAYLHDLLARQGAANRDAARMRADLVNAAAKAVQLYPANAALHAELAEACAATGRFDIAAREARAALRLDTQMPHPDKKLPDALRARLRAAEPKWTEQAARKSARLPSRPLGEHRAERRGVPASRPVSGLSSDALPREAA
jgi:O-antigen ligase